MALKRAVLSISGDIQMVGFRSFVKTIADSLGITGYAENLPNGRVNIVCEGEEIDIEKLVNSMRKETPAFSKIENLQIKYGEYIGEFIGFERRGNDVPKKATLDDLLNVMISFDHKGEKIIGLLGEIKQDTAQIRQDTTQIRQDTSQIREDTSQIREDTSQIREDTSQIREDTSQIRKDTSQIRQDTAQIRQDTAQIREDTSQIPKIVENTRKILEHTSHIPAIAENTSLIPAMKEDTAAIKNDSREIVDKLQNKYEELSREISQMKITLSRIEEKVFG